MCGVAGAVRLAGDWSTADRQARVEAMLESQLHRGPDDGGIAHVGPVTLGSRRLAIIDLSAAGHMPMSDPSSRWWITYNGEVYNFPALRAELEGRGHGFRSETDTEVVLHAFMEWGPECIHRLVGMFAMAIADRETGALTLMRDRLGIKPLYYAHRGGRLLFASEIKALAEAAGDDIPGPGTGSSAAGLKVREHSLLEWSLYRNVDALSRDTLLEGVSSLLPGEILTVRGGEISRSRAYVPWERISREEYERLGRAGPDDIVDEVEEVLVEAVTQRLVSDVPMGTLLSGGLDSSLVTSLAARRRPDLTAFHVSVAGFPDLDERRHAEALSEALDLEMVAFELTAERFRRALPRTVYHSDLPLTHPNSVAYHLISRVVRERGTVVLLSGEGADELFGGYRWAYRRRRMLLRLLPVLGLL
ncbi:MAG TPA: asparagine synthase (glutamine-hydrolyzing), partial [Longimicrobiales bacterium]|nr:asparagine synthase (glutamine-hydrolyzing) [Longimicrobiales bacterium]